MNEHEIAHLKSVEAFIAYGIRNGLSFAAIIQHLKNDADRLAKLDFNAEDSKQLLIDGDYSPDAVGSPD